MKQLDMVDAVIVGAGAAGSLMAAKLARAGKKVVVLEAGPPWQLRDLYSSEIWARRLKWNTSPVIGGGANPINVGFNIGGGLGGSALHHYANWYRFHAGDFKERTLYGQNFDWPITYDDLRPWYDRIQSEVGVSGDAKAEIWRPPGAPYPMPPLPYFRQAELIAGGFAALGIRTAPLPHAINTVRYNGREACLNDGWCDAGCPIGALANPLVTYLPQAKQAGAEFRTGARVTSIVTGPSGKRAAGAIYYGAGEQGYFQPASVVILASFAIETPRLLLNSATSKFPQGLANSSGTVGCYLMPHISGVVYGLFDEDTQPYLGVTGGALTSQDSYDNKVKPDYFGSYQWMGAGALKPNDVLGIANARTDLFGAALQSFVQTAVRGIGNMILLGETRPQVDNRLTLSSQKDPLGVPLAQTTHAYDVDALTLFSSATVEGVNVMKAAGATQAWAGAPQPQHILGGARMGADPATSVTNSYGQTHDVANLFVTGSSLFPTSAAVNPTFTIHALTFRAADYLLKNWGAIAA